MIKVRYQTKIIIYAGERVLLKTFDVVFNNELEYLLYSPKDDYPDPWGFGRHSHEGHLEVVEISREDS